MPTIRKPAFDALLDAAQPERFQTGDLGLREALGGELLERLTSPQHEGLVRLALIDHVLETLRVELVGAVEPKQIARRLRLHPLLAEDFSKLRDVHLKGLLC